MIINTKNKKLLNEGIEYFNILRAETMKVVNIYGSLEDKVIDNTDYKLNIEYNKLERLKIFKPKIIHYINKMNNSEGNIIIFDKKSSLSIFGETREDEIKFDDYLLIHSGLNLKDNKIDLEYDAKYDGEPTSLKIRKDNKINSYSFNNGKLLVGGQLKRDPIVIKLINNLLKELMDRNKKRKTIEK